MCWREEQKRQAILTWQPAATALEVDNRAASDDGAHGVSDHYRPVVRVTRALRHAFRQRSVDDGGCWINEKVGQECVELCGAKGHGLCCTGITNEEGVGLCRPRFEPEGTWERFPRCTSAAAPAVYEHHSGAYGLRSAQQYSSIG
jgi:hypothetical protein